MGTNETKRFEVYAKGRDGVLSVLKRIGPTQKLCTSDLDEAIQQAKDDHHSTEGVGHYVVIENPGYGQQKIKMFDTSVGVSAK